LEIQYFAFQKDAYKRMYNLEIYLHILHGLLLINKACGMSLAEARSFGNEVNQGRICTVATWSRAHAPFKFPIGINFACVFGFFR
jgi:hypothetical protein